MIPIGVCYWFSELERSNEVRLAHFCGIDGEADAKVVTITEINKFIGH